MTSPGNWSMMNEVDPSGLEWLTPPADAKRWVTLKAAATLDGKIATKTGESQWITDADARRLGHWLRHTHDAILVGVNTALTDNPALTTRDIPEGRHPARVVLDSHGRLPETSRLLEEDGVPVFVATGREAPGDRFRERPNVTVLKAATARPELPWVLDQLAECGHRKVLIEGGSQLHASALSAGLPNRLVLFLAPKVIGGQAALGWCGEWGAETLADTARWSIRTHQSVGEDVMIVADYLAKKEG